MKQLILTSVRKVIYFKRKTGQEMSLNDFKRRLLKNLTIIRLREITTKDFKEFDKRWNVFIEPL